MSHEDKILNKIIESKSRANVDFKTEVHYNHYGSRGVVDLVIEEYNDPSQDELQAWANSHELPIEIAHQALGSTVVSVVELKSHSAIKSCTGANEITRQFNSHREYFVKGTDDYNTSQKMFYWLIFVCDEKCHQHLSQNRAIYKNLHDEDDVFVAMWHPGYDHPVTPFNGGNFMSFDQCILTLNLQQERGAVIDKWGQVNIVKPSPKTNKEEA